MKRLIEFFTGLTAWGAPGLFLLAILDGLWLPLPGGVDVLLITLCAQRPDSAFLFAFTTVLGSFIGNYILFLIAKRGGEAYIRKRTLSKSGARFRRWFQHYGLLTVFISALVPLPIMPMKIFVLCAGALGSPQRAFIAVFLLARVIRYNALAALGAAMGDRAWDFLRDHKWQLGAIALGLFVVLYALVKIADRRRAGRPSTQQRLESRS